MVMLGRALSVLLAASVMSQSGCSPDSPSDAKDSGHGETDTSPALALAASRGSGSAAVAKEFYVPKPGDFRTIYERDGANKARQAWDEYYGWIKTFYAGNLFESGWTKRAVTMLEGLRSEQMRGELRASLNELSKLLAAEWAKDNSVRKVDNSDLRAFGSRFLEAKAKDDGNGAVIRREITAIRHEIDSRFRR